MVSEYDFTSLDMLRQEGSTIPVEVCMKDSSEETVGLCKDLARNGVVCQLLHYNVSVSGFTVGFQFQNHSNIYFIFLRSPTLGR